MTQRNTGIAPARSVAILPLDRRAVVCFFVLVVIVGLRPLIQETHDTERMPFASVLAELPDISPLPTLWINLIIIGVFGLTMALRFQGRLPKPRCTGLMLGFVIVAFAAGASCLIASNKRLAINTTLDWMTLPLLAIALAHLLQYAWQMRLVLCVIIASGVASAVETFDQALNTLPQTVKMYEQDKEEYWQRQGVAPDSYQIKLFEKRVYEQAANGFFAMANIAGSYFVLTIFAALALAGGNWTSDTVSTRHSVRESARAEARGSLTSRMDHNLRAFLMVMMSLPMIGALWFSKSRGALLALLLGLFVVFLLYVFRHTIAGNRRRTFILGWAVVVGGLGCVGAYGLAKGSLPGGSLTYRWWYLETTAKMVADHPLLGVGSGQYSRFYPRYKEIKSPEEISNPHNFLAQAAAEWGIGGLAGMMLMLVGGSWGVAGLRIADCGLRNEKASRAPPHGDGNIPHPMLWGALLFLGIWAMQIWIVGHDFNYVYAQLTFPMLGWMAAFAVGAVCGVTSSSPIKASTFPITLAGILGVGLFAFLIHNLITFSLFIPGAATTFFALLGVCISIHSDKKGVVSHEHTAESPRHGRSRLRLAPPIAIATLMCITIVYWFGIQPVSRCWEDLCEARRLARTNIDQSKQHYVRALSADVLDPTPMREWVQLLALAPHAELGFTDQMGRVPPYTRNGLRARDPENVSVFRVSIGALLAEYALHPQRAELLEKIARYYEQVLQLYPTNPKDRIRMSAILLMQYKRTGDVSALRRAGRELATALDLNSRRDPLEVRRFSEERLAELQTRLAKLKSMLVDAEPRGLTPDNP